MKAKTHRFILDVKSHDTRRGAEIDVLACFAARKPDGCEFYLRKTRPARKAKPCS